MKIQDIVALTNTLDERHRIEVLVLIIGLLWKVLRQHASDEVIKGMRVTLENTVRQTVYEQDQASSETSYLELQKLVTQGLCVLISDRPDLKMYMYKERIYSCKKYLIEGTTRWVVNNEGML